MLKRPKRNESEQGWSMPSRQVLWTSGLGLNRPSYTFKQQAQLLEWDRARREAQQEEAQRAQKIEQEALRARQAAEIAEKEQRAREEAAAATERARQVRIMLFVLSIMYAISRATCQAELKRVEAERVKARALQAKQVCVVLFIVHLITHILMLCYHSASRTC